MGAGAGGTTGSGTPMNNGGTTNAGSVTGSGPDLSGVVMGGYDAGISGSVPFTGQGAKLNGASGANDVGTSQEHVGQHNKSTSLGDGT